MFRAHYETSSAGKENKNNTIEATVHGKVFSLYSTVVLIISCYHFSYCSLLGESSNKSEDMAISKVKLQSEEHLPKAGPLVSGDLT